METIQVPDEIAIQVDMHEVQIHMKWGEYDIALPLPVARMVADATAYLADRTGNAPAPRQSRDAEER